MFFERIFKFMDKEVETSEEEVKVDAVENECQESQEPELTEVEKLSAEVADLQAKFLYLQADYQNYRKRTIKDLSDARMMGTSMTLEPFLRVFDYLNMAKSAAENSDNIDSMRQGIAMIIGEYVKAFDDLGVKRLDAVGKPFDPAWQEAVQNEPSDSVEEGVVIKEWTPAYQLGEKILRAAKVVVSAGPAKCEEESEEQE